MKHSIDTEEIRFRILKPRPALLSQTRGELVTMLDNQRTDDTIGLRAKVDA